MTNRYCTQSFIRQLKIPHIVYSSESADEALNQVDQKSSKNQWMLSGKRRVIEPPAPKQKLALTPVPLPKLGYIQITVTEVRVQVFLILFHPLVCVLALLDDRCWTFLGSTVRCCGTQ